MVSHLNHTVAWFNYFRCDRQHFGLPRHNAFLPITTNYLASRDSTSKASCGMSTPFYHLQIIWTLWAAKQSSCLYKGAWSNLDHQSICTIHYIGKPWKQYPQDVLKPCYKNCYLYILTLCNETLILIFPFMNIVTSMSKVKKPKSWHPTKAHTPWCVSLMHSHSYLTRSCRNVVARE